MKYFNLVFLLLFLGNITASAQSINHSQKLVDLIQTKKWFEVENYYQQHKDSIDSEFVKPYYLATTGAIFNRPYETISAYEQLIDSNPLKMNTPTLASFFGQPCVQLCADVQEYARGEELCRKFITLFQKDSSETRSKAIQSWTQIIESFKQFSKNIPTLTVSKNAVDNVRDVKLLPDNNKSGNGIYFNAKWNGINLRTHFDTGASGCYIYKRAIAEKLGIKLITTDTIVLNDGNIRILTGIVDSLELGDFIIKNVPVSVNIETIDTADSSQEKCDSFLNSEFDIILGLPVIQRLGVIEFDFNKNTMSFPQNTNKTYKRNIYIENSKLFMNMKICDTNFLTLFDTGGKGLSITADFYEKHKQCIPIETQAIQTRGLWGGCNKPSLRYGFLYNCPQIDIKINDQKITMQNDCSVPKEQGNDNKTNSIENGFLGNAIFKYCKKAIFDFDKMVFSVEK